MTGWNRVATSTGTGCRLHFSFPDEPEYARTVQQLVDDRVASKLGDKDPTLWGAEAEPEASKRLSWVNLADASRPLVPRIEQLRAELAERGLDHVVLCGMGGSSLAPEVICRTAGVELSVVDSSSPGYVRAAIEDRLERSVVVVSSKSGGTVETDSQRRAYEQAFRDAGLDPAAHIVVVTDPGSPFEQLARESGYRVFTADPEVGGRYSALTAFGLVPSGLAGADIGRLLDEAGDIADALRADSVDNPALRLGALLGSANLRGVDKLVLADAGSDLPGLGDWIEQLVAESTGKQGRGILPVVVADPEAPNFDPNTTDEVLVSFGPGTPFESVHPASGFGASLDAPLGAQILLWECAVAVTGHLIGINPFDQPDVESAKQAARDQLGATGPTDAVFGDAVFQDAGVTVYASRGWLPEGTATVADAVTVLLTQIDPSAGYLAVMVYLDPGAEAELAAVRDALATRTGRPTTFGWGPRFLHSTGQYHKGGPPNGVFLQVTAAPEADLDVPGQEFTFGEFIAAQAGGDAAVLAGHGRPVLRLHLDGSRAATETVGAALT